MVIYLLFTNVSQNFDVTKLPIVYLQNFQFILFTPINSMGNSIHLRIMIKGVFLNQFHLFFANQLPIWLA